VNPAAASASLRCIRSAALNSGIATSRLNAFSAPRARCASPATPVKNSSMDWL